MKKIILFACFITVIGQKQNLLAQPIAAGANIAVTNTEGGKVRGYTHNGIFTYKGIPYAQAERFAAPTKATKL